MSSHVTSAVLDALVIVPFQPASSYVSLDSKYRETVGAAMALPLASAMLELEAYIGHPLSFWEERNRPRFGDEPMPYPDHRSLTAIVLATALESADLRWAVIDPGTADLDFWRRKLINARNFAPRTVAISTTFVTGAPWLRALCAMVREILPRTKIIVGGYYYATNVEQFLRLDADVLCVGEGEVRLPEIVKRLSQGLALSDVAGLYIADGKGGLEYTGPVSPIGLSKIAPPNWDLSMRIDPPVDLSLAAVEFGIETQRGCFFKCEFCNYRTLSPLQALDPAAAVDAILRTAAYNRGFVNITDSTASYPHNRWEELLTRLAARGGSPHPIWAFTRVSDITESRAALMAAAGVREVFIGQESGNQEILNLMKKGTKIAHVHPAISALRAHSIGATVSFIHGFPGETDRTIVDTRSLISNLNKPDWQNPTVFSYIIYPFACLDFASVAQRPMFSGISHYLGYDSAPISGKRAAEEALATIIAVSRIPYAPVYALLTEAGPPTSGLPAFVSPQRAAIFRWLKCVERGAAMFLERDLDGAPLSNRELRRIRSEIRSALSARATLSRVAAWVRAHSANMLVRRLIREWDDERSNGPGVVTRMAALATVAMQTKSIALSRMAWSRGSIWDGRGDEAGPTHGADMYRELARELVSRAITSTKTRRTRSDLQGAGVTDGPL